MPFHRSISLLFVGFILSTFSIKLLNVSALNCEQGSCQCATTSGGSAVFISEKYQCDGEEDCSDGSDELGCVDRECLITEHKCGNGRCIKKSWTCDNYADCHDGSDEEQSLCNFTTCRSDQFRCRNGYCLPGRFECDKSPDCLGGEDEHARCVFPVNCSADFFQCNNKKCVDKSFQCDGEDDCDDNSDEADCGKTCSPTSFTCKSGKCIPENLKCNGKNDCLDGSDEESCATVSPPTTPPTCLKNEFLCDGACQPGFVRCDGEDDCADKSDEFECAGIQCGTLERSCDDGKTCINEWEFCDGTPHCPDGSDEKVSKCQPTTTKVAPTTEFACGNDEYKCKNASKCINKTNICDENRDCPDGDDEVSCLIDECKRDNGNCSHICHDTETSYYCSCKHGYKLLNDSKTCKDINECDIIGQCSQKCTNTHGSYKCSCTSNYVLSPNGRNCNPTTAEKEKLLVAVGLDVRSIENDGSRMKCLVSKNVKDVVAVGLHQKKNVMFWADAYVGKIFSSVFGHENTPAKVVAADRNLKDLAIDWITEKLYWLTTNALQVSTISVAEFNGSNKQIIITVKEGIHSIAVDPIGGYLYWTSLRAGKISRSHMNGQFKEDIITTLLRAPTGLTIDYPNNKLFWLDSKMHHIESSDLDGKNRRHVVCNLHHPFDVAVFGDNVYWSDSILKTVSSANKFTGKSKRVLIRKEKIASFVPKGISIHHSLSQPSVDNRCRNNGGCSHLCLLVPNGFKCACPETGVLLPDEKNCKMPVTGASSTTRSTGTISPTTGANGNVKARSKSAGSGMSSQVLGGIIAGVVCVLFILIIVIVWCRRKRNARKMEIHYSSEAGHIKFVSADGGNPTQSKKDVGRDVCFMFGNQNFKIDEDGEEDLDNIAEKKPVFKTFRHQEDGEVLINAKMV